MIPIKEIVETMPAEVQKEMYRELKEKLEPKPVEKKPTDEEIKDLGRLMQL